jgi:hypothetical protein
VDEGHILVRSVRGDHMGRTNCRRVVTDIKNKESQVKTVKNVVIVIVIVVAGAMLGHSGFLR